ncbi:hypothetical protein MVEN_02343700 [Mycena venus]|uniref:Uncharacterized protein n=1 Tax=Mycena venus TaxID=2733690 RepID=A0A8H7CEU8_9AGAR|nr:hypothetical protein MVEN_02343700 [Mycena venus]
MHKPLVVWALSVAFALVAAQSTSDSALSPPISSSSNDDGDGSTSSFPSPPTASAGFPAPSSAFVTSSATGPFPSGFFPSTPTFSFGPAGSRAAATALPSSASVPASGSTNFSKGPVIGAAVGGSIAASLVVLAGALLCLCLRTRNIPAPPVEGLHAAGSGSRAWRHAGSGGSSAAAVLYTNEKDGLALDGKAVKDQPPTYLD